MYSIRLRTNKRLDEYHQGDHTDIGVRMRDGSVRYLPWGGFTLDMAKPVKLVVEAFTLEDDWNPRDPTSKMPRWHTLEPGEHLLGSLQNQQVFTVLPFRVVPVR